MPVARRNCLSLVAGAEAQVESSTDTVSRDKTGTPPEARFVGLGRETGGYVQCAGASV